MSAPVRRLARALVAAGALLAATLFATSAARAQDLPEYRLKAAFVYNFILFTEFPAEVGTTLNLCIHGPDPFGKEIDGLHGKAAGARSIAVQRKGARESLKGCQVVFFADAAAETLPRLVESVHASPC